MRSYCWSDLNIYATLTSLGHELNSRSQGSKSSQICLNFAWIFKRLEISSHLKVSSCLKISSYLRISSKIQVSSKFQAKANFEQTWIFKPLERFKQFSSFCKFCKFFKFFKQNVRKSFLHAGIHLVLRNYPRKTLKSGLSTLESHD